MPMLDPLESRMNLDEFAEHSIGLYDREQFYYDAFLRAYQDTFSSYMLNVFTALVVLFAK